MRRGGLSPRARSPNPPASRCALVLLNVSYLRVLPEPSSLPPHHPSRTVKRCKNIATFFGGDPELKFQNIGSASKEKRDAHMQAWKEWNARLIKKGALEAGYPLDAMGARIDASGSEECVLSDESARGFLVLNAESLAAAVAVLTDAPIIKNGRPHRSPLVWKNLTPGTHQP
jgi:hypothetical protein